MFRFTVNNMSVALITFTCAFSVYFYCLPPSITGEDAGELITSAYVLGIPHPPGYPLWCLVAHPFTWLPWGDIAWRVHLSSAFFAALGVGVMALLMEKITRSNLAAIAGALALAFSREFWEQAIIAEVYALNALLVAACLLLLWQWYELRLPRWLWAFAIVFGLGLANHNTFILLAPAFAAWVFGIDGAPWKRWKLYLGLAACATMVAFCVYLYLPLRSLMNPPMDWGNPETFSNWMRHILREQYAFMMGENPRNAGRFFWQVSAMSKQAFHEFTPLIFLIIPAGIVGLCLNKFRYAALLVLASSSVFVGFVLIQNPSNDREWLTVMSVFMIPVYMFFALGIAWFSRTVNEKLGINPAFLLTMLVLFCPLWVNTGHNNRRHDYWTADYLNNILGGMSAEAIFIPTMDHSTFGTIYMQEVMGFRRDITLGRRYGYIEVALAAGMPKEKLSEFGEFPPRRFDPEIIAWVLQNTARPVYVDTYLKLPGITCAPAGMIYRLLREGETDAWDYWAGYQWHTLAHADTRGDYTADLVLGQYFFAKARDAFAENDSQSAVEFLEFALEATGRDALFLNQAGVCAARGGEYHVAATYFEKAHLLRPENMEISGNFERVKRKL